MVRIVFPDKDISYNDFLEDLAASLVPKIKEALLEPNDTVSQNKAFARYGKANVLRWVRKGALSPLSKRPGKIEYLTKDLKKCQSRLQDYLT